MKPSIQFGLLLLGLVICSCASFRSPVSGLYNQQPEINKEAEKVSVLFVFRHYKQSVGYDVVPKLSTPYLNGFGQIFNGALDEFSNIEKFETWSLTANSINDSRENAELNDLKSQYDYVIDMKFSKENSFVSFSIGTLIEIGGLTLIPYRFRDKYKAEFSVSDNAGNLLATYNREAHLDTWVQAFLLVVYPFHNDQENGEELYLECMHDIFRQIESEGVLAKKAR
ncbi:Ig-like domain repeat protein [Mangrovibacterium diazotrophicum]|uniref:Ig-like domain-containing protein n=1 Tax=Mangrovibacterium diazotrophicum TaxID=1261403 RepID=A0A419W6K5_9BACT|nr:Ig-like domain repeat protein [Mangrovibacterium diazotrophicum]RKD91101.1 hypothetical protein BC643_1450 [Mangrovibacterium diazotrophicum]